MIWNLIIIVVISNETRQNKIIYVFVFSLTIFLLCWPFNKLSFTLGLILSPFSDNLNRHAHKTIDETMNTLCFAVVLCSNRWDKHNGIIWNVKKGTWKTIGRREKDRGMLSRSHDFPYIRMKKMIRDWMCERRQTARCFFLSLNIVFDWSLYSCCRIKMPATIHVWMLRRMWIAIGSLVSMTKLHERASERIINKREREHCWCAML